MYTLINENDFIDKFNKIRPRSFTYEGLSVLYAYLLEMESDDIGDELDILAIDSSYAEYTDLKSYNDDNNANYEDLDELQKHHAAVIMIDNNSFIISIYSK